MAKGKQQELTLEEKLEQALAPEDEQLHKVPGNWVWIKVWSILSEIKNGTTAKQNKEGIGAKVTRIESIQNNKIDFNRLGYISDLDTIKVTDWYMTNDIVFSHINSAEHVGKTAIISEDILPLVHGMNLLRLRFNKACFPKYFYYYSQSFQYKQSILQRINMAVNQVSINQKQVGDLEFPLPPLTEQQRIVDRIESLFAKLDQARELAQNALDTFETRKAAILHKAFTGELTAKWREKNGVGMESWEDKRLVDVCSKITDGTHHSPRNYDTGDFMYITAKNIKEYGIDLSNITYISEEVHREIYKRCNVEYEDVLYIKDGATTGIATVNTLKEEFSLLSSVALLKPNRKILDPKYLAYILNSSEIKTKMLNNMSGNAITRLTISKIQQSSIIVPSLPEQEEIVRILDSLFEKEQKAKELCDVIDKIDLMKKAVLARAFRGELGTNDPSEESAVELLKECLGQPSN